MDAVDFLRTKARMCKAYDTCQVCPAQGRCTNNIVSTWNDEEIKKSVAIFEQWEAEHPQETRWAKLKKQYPNITKASKYQICVRDLGYVRQSCGVLGCEECWNELVDD